MNERNATAAEQGLITERFTRAVEQLGAEQIAMRVGAIYALERIAIDSERDRGHIMETLNAFLRYETMGERLADDALEHATLRIDVNAALSVLARGPLRQWDGADR